MRLPIAAGAIALALLLGGCTPSDLLPTPIKNLVNVYGTVTGASISSGRALTYNDGLRTIQDAVTAYTNGCVAAGSTTGACAYADQAYDDLLVLREDRKQLLAYAKAHESVPLGAGGVLALTENAVATVQAILKNAGISTPNITP
jgi:hypothetical protein